MKTAFERLPSGTVTTPRGFRAGATYAGIKKKSDHTLDLAILFSDVPCAAAAMFTTNKVRAAPVVLSQQRVKSGRARAVIINAGCANAVTGERGLRDAASMADMAARALGIASEEVLVASTGVIGQHLPIEKIADAVPKIALTAAGGHDLARAIMTTDRVPKEIAVRAGHFCVGGVAKGAGMIHPDMATMLAFLTTDAAVEHTLLQGALKKAVDRSLNMVSVDGDTSTNDTMILLANGMAGGNTIAPGTAEAALFQDALNEVCTYLAKAIARDGEGATRLIEVDIRGARSDTEARLAARTVTSSCLVKTAVHGCDPNWGRVLAAVGRSGAGLVEAKTDLYIGDICLLRRGTPQPCDAELVSRLLGQTEVGFRVELNLGEGQATAWGCDLSEEYVAINAEYTT